jgi:glycosyltransferase involved in cell wall biosynthesis
MAIALLTTYLAGYRIPLYERLAERHGVEVLCYGRGERYVPAWFQDLDAQIASAPFPASRLHGPREAFALGKRYEAVIAPFAGGEILPAAFLGARRHHRPFVLWASVWAQPRSPEHALARPLTRYIYRHADSAVAYGEHVRRFVARIRGHDDDVFVAPQAVEAGLFGREVGEEEIVRFRFLHGLDGPIVLYVGRLVPEKGIEVLLDAWTMCHAKGDATLVLIGDGPLAYQAAETPGVRLVGPLERTELPVPYAASELVVLPSIPTARFREPWGLVCNEAMHQGRPVVATDAVGAAAGGLVQDGEGGLVVPADDSVELMRAIDRLLADDLLRTRLGAAAREAVKPYTYDAMVEGFDRALAVAMPDRGGVPNRGSV